MSANSIRSVMLLVIVLGLGAAASRAHPLAYNLGNDAGRTPTGSSVLYVTCPEEILVAVSDGAQPFQFSHVDRQPSGLYELRHTSGQIQSGGWAMIQTELLSLDLVGGPPIVGYQWSDDRGSIGTVQKYIILDANSSGEIGRGTITVVPADC